MQKHKKVRSTGLVFVESGTGESTKPWASSTDATDDTDWQEDKPTSAKLKGHVAWAGEQAAAGANRVPCSPVHPLYLCITLITRFPLASKLSPLQPMWGAELRGAWGWAVLWLQLSLDRIAPCCVQLGWAASCLLCSLRAPQGRQGAGSALCGDMGTKSGVTSLLLEISRLPK